MILRFFDILFSLLGLVILLPLISLIAIAIRIDSKGPILFKQIRVGQYAELFAIRKFRTMVNQTNPDTISLTIGLADSRITKIGYFLRIYKLDELPQLLNVFLGQMSLVGPRPEVPEYVQYYTENEKKVLSIKPGITDWASLIFINEEEILKRSSDLENDYINIIMRQKLRLNTYYLDNYSIKNYFMIIYYTIKSLLGFKIQPPDIVD